MERFEHDRLDMYKAAIEFLALADTIAGALPRGRAYLVDQLRRAATSISLNIAEGAGEFAPADKARFYRMARRSATEAQRSSMRLAYCRSRTWRHFSKAGRFCCASWRCSQARS